MTMLWAIWTFCSAEKSLVCVTWALRSNVLRTACCR